MARSGTERPTGAAALGRDRCGADDPISWEMLPKNSFPREKMHRSPSVPLYRLGRSGCFADGAYWKKISWQQDSNTSFDPGEA